ncbi:MAG TPA: HemK family protein methyltransferase [Candidatus Absconditabacterales bacterium]|nr:HemK family protein methyltransferase [Candidatus Absconditabacterales bacterium]
MSTLFSLVSNPHYQYKHVLTKLIQHHTGVPYQDIILHYHDEVSSDMVSRIDSDYHAYAHDKKPLEYIMRQVAFLGNQFVIDSRAMIPRPETEYMIQAVVEMIDKRGSTPYYLLDLGCGCGVLGLSVAFLSINKPILVSSRDISADAVALTGENIQLYQQKLPNISFQTRVSNGLAGLDSDEVLHQTWTDNPLVIVCNYPYIPDETFDANVDESAKIWEPRLAFVAGKDGLDLYRRLFAELIHYKLTHATLFLEMMTWQMDILDREFGINHGGVRYLEVVKTFHFNIIIVKVQFKG